MKAHSNIAAILKQTIGFDVATAGRSALVHAVRSRTRACGLSDAESYCALLQSSETELQELIEAVVVPETWFCRDRDAFTALAKLITSQWFPTQSGRVLRILSVPCSTGEEPYSIAMALLGAGLPPHTFKIDALDISARALALAKRGRFGRNSFRGRELDFRDRYFHSHAQTFELAATVRERVHFEQGNLLAADFLAGADSYDVIFCRNVLIYFDAPTQERVIKTLDRLLASDGFLFVGPAEAYLVRGTGFVSADQPRSFAYRKKPAVSPEPPVFQEPSRRKMKSTSPRPAQRPAPKIAAKPQPKIETQPPRSLPSVGLETAVRLADAGKLHEAAKACEGHLRENGTSPAAFYLLGLVRDALGDEKRAADCYRKVVYLEPTHADALMHLALLAEKRGDTSTARRLQLRSRRVEGVAMQ